MYMNNKASTSIALILDTSENTIIKYFNLISVIQVIIRRNTS